jgi:hypothetical protein
MSHSQHNERHIVSQRGRLQTAAVNLACEPARQMSQALPQIPLILKAEMSRQVTRNITYTDTIGA